MIGINSCHQGRPVVQESDVVGAKQPEKGAGEENPLED
jgi:hypothetical protein